MKLISRISVASLAFALGAGMWIGCGGDDTSPATPGKDSGKPDTSNPGMDSGPPPNLDSGPSPDTGPGSDTGPGPDSATGTMFTATLTGAQEVPAVTTTSTGTGTFTLSADKTTLAYDVTTTATVMAAHIHTGAAGESGGVIFTAATPGAHMTGTFTLTAAQATDLQNGTYYFNIHTAANGNGEIRGQILPAGATLWVANLTGAQETPAVVSNGTGTAAVILNAAKNSIHFHVKTSLTPTAMHIHNNIASLSGPVKFTLGTTAATVDGDQAVVAADVTDLTDGHYYVNIHTTVNGNGELRGQLIKSGETLYSAALSPANEVPPVLVSAATGGGQFILSEDKKNLRYEVTIAGVTPTNTHIHTGTVGNNGGILYTLLPIPNPKGTQAVTAADLIPLDAAGLYCNVHTAANTGGEMRAQITKQ